MLTSIIAAVLRLHTIVIEIALKAYEGYVRCIYNDEKVFVTSPNMKSLPNLLIGTQQVRLRRDLHFGEHDPCLSPQPFHEETLHLPLIPFPGLSEGGTKVLWVLPSEDDFEPMADVEITRILSRTLIPPHPSSLSTTDDVAPCQPSSDPKVRAYRARLHYLLQHLWAPAVYGEAAMMWRIAQCVGLELDA
ncbi:hypothetical protein BDP27DRAFT_1429844 [Rhodocollybia butyracea]|uniref:Uncharacterized protein n=1 Tax=Rhodocollybia butyracea TaxID=206335 RepID=A0A9P5TZT7_9AGAR|nr:hypothetical protein BDP27DRAFT_1429844 [Rhodocollybia butyracea]